MLIKNELPEQADIEQREANRTEQEILYWRQLRLIHRNYVQGVFGYTLVALFTSYLIYQATLDLRSIVWVAVMCMEAIASIAIFSFGFERFFGRNVTFDTQIVLCLVLIQSLTYTYLPFTFIPEGDPSVVILLCVISASLAAGSVALSSPFFVGFVASSYPSMLTVSYALYLREEPLYQWLGFAFALMLVGLTWFAVTLTRTIQQSIELSLENQGLVKDLRSALNETDEANRAKSVFLASASHDLRQPLHALGLLNESLGRTELSDAQHEIHQHMNSALGSTREMLDALLDISKLDAGAISAQPRSFLIRNVLNKLESELAPTADEKELIFRTRETIAAAYSDPFLVELILRNLIANAIRYTKTGGLLVACRKRRDHLSLEVWDTGVGIAECEHHTIFKAFQQIGNPERDSRKGFGLGLAIAQGLASTINSRISIESRVGKGSVFRFLIPKATEEVIEDINQELELDQFKGITVMVVDDAPHIRASMNSVLRSWGCICILAESAEDALAAPNANQTQILLSDYRLREGVTGKDVVQLVRNELKRHIPAILITGDTGSERIRDAQTTDALLLHKPASATQLYMMMRKLLD